MAPGRGPDRAAGQAGRRSDLWLGQRIRRRRSQAPRVQGRPPARLQRRVSRLRRRRGLCPRGVVDGGGPRLAALHAGRTPQVLGTAVGRERLLAAEPAQRDASAAQLARRGQLPRGAGLLRLARCPHGGKRPTADRATLVCPASLAPVGSRGRPARLEAGTGQHQSRTRGVEHAGRRLSAGGILRRHRQRLAVDSHADHALQGLRGASTLRRLLGADLRRPPQPDQGRFVDRDRQRGARQRPLRLSPPLLPACRVSLDSRGTRERGGHRGIAALRDRPTRHPVSRIPLRSRSVGCAQLPAGLRGGGHAACAGRPSPEVPRHRLLRRKVGV